MCVTGTSDVSQAPFKIQVKTRLNSVISSWHSEASHKLSLIYGSVTVVSLVTLKFMILNVPVVPWTSDFVIHVIYSIIKRQSPEPVLWEWVLENKWRQESSELRCSENCAFQNGKLGQIETQNALPRIKRNSLVQKLTWESFGEWGCRHVHEDEDKERSEIQLVWQSLVYHFIDVITAKTIVWQAHTVVWLHHFKGFT